MPCVILPRLFAAESIMSCLLIVDASSSLCSVALSRGSESWSLCEDQPRRHAQRLLPMVDELLIRAGVKKAELEGIAYGRGPGSFTGIRIAASVLQGIAFALELPVCGISSLQSVALKTLRSSQADHVMAVMDAHMGEVFWGHFQREGELCRLIGAEHVGSPEQCLQALKAFDGIVAGDGLTLPAFASCAQEWADVQPQADIMLALAEDAWQRGEFGSVEQHPPVYLRDSVAWKKLDEQPSLLRRD